MPVDLSELPTDLLIYPKDLRKDLLFFPKKLPKDLLIFPKELPKDLPIFLCRSSEPPYLSGSGDLALFYDTDQAH